MISTIRFLNRQIFQEAELVQAMKQYVLECGGEEALQAWLKENELWSKGMLGLMNDFEERYINVEYPHKVISS